MRAVRAQLASRSYDATRAGDEEPEIESVLINWICFDPLRLQESCSQPTGRLARLKIGVRGQTSEMRAVMAAEFSLHAAELVKRRTSMEAIRD